MQENDRTGVKVRHYVIDDLPRGNIPSLYSREKTLCDCMRRRKQIGQDVIKEMMASCLKGHNRNLDMLLKYAKICNVTKEIQTYLDVLS